MTYDIERIAELAMQISDNYCRDDQFEISFDQEYDQEYEGLHDIGFLIKVLTQFRQNPVWDAHKYPSSIEKETATLVHVCPIRIFHLFVIMGHDPNSYIAFLARPIDITNKGYLIYCNKIMVEFNLTPSDQTIMGLV